MDVAASGWACCYVDDVVAHHRPSSSRLPSAWRRRVELRDDLLTAWPRRPAGVVLGEVERRVAIIS
ncbi:hypothetical protein AB0H12_02255 [Actinosynnema sp. NPDC023794]